MVITFELISMYVKYQGMCDEPELIKLTAVTQEDVFADEAIPEPLMQEKAIVPNEPGNPLCI